MAPEVGGTAFDDGIESGIDATDALEVDDGQDPYEGWSEGDPDPEPAAESNDLDDGDEYVEEGAEDEGAPASGDVPAGWDWAKGLNPEHVQRSWEKFTQGMQEISAREAALQPYQQLYNELQTDPQLQAYLRAYFNGEPVAPPGRQVNPELMAVQDEMKLLQTQLEVDREFKSLHALVASEGFPPVDEAKVMQYAIDHNIPSMEAAYYGLNFRAARDTGREGAFEEVKRGKRAAVPKVGAKSDRGGRAVTTKDIADMTEEEFNAAYGDASFLKSVIG